MKTKGIRIEVPQDVYLKLLDEQNRQKSLTGKISSLSIIFLKFGELGIKYWEESKTKSVAEQHPKQKNVLPDQSMSNVLSAKERELQAKEKELKSWETNLRAREFELIEKSKTINESSEDLMEQRNDIYDQKEILQEKSQETLKLKIQKENLEKILIDRNEQLLHLHQELKEMKQNIFKVLLNIDKKTESNVFMKFILPILPLIAIVISTLILKKEMRSGENLSQAERDIIKAFNELNPDDQEQIRNYLNDMLKKPGKE